MQWAEAHYNIKKGNLQNFIAYWGYQVTMNFVWYGLVQMKFGLNEGEQSSMSCDLLCHLWVK